MSHSLKLLHDILYDGTAILVNIKLDMVHEILVRLDFVSLTLGDLKKESMDEIQWLS